MSIFRRFSPEYIRYMSSTAWDTKRKAALKRADYRCQICGESAWLQMHHRFYGNLGHEKDADLTVLCKYCHKWVTFAIRLRRFWRWLVI